MRVAGGPHISMYRWAHRCSSKQSSRSHSSKQLRRLQCTLVGYNPIRMTTFKFCDTSHLDTLRPEYCLNVAHALATPIQTAYSMTLGPLWFVVCANCQVFSGLEMPL